MCGGGSQVPVSWFISPILSFHLRLLETPQPARISPILHSTLTTSVLSPGYGLGYSACTRHRPWPGEFSRRTILRLRDTGAPRTRTDHYPSYPVTKTSKCGSGAIFNTRELTKPADFELAGYRDEGNRSKSTKGDSSALT